MILYRKELMAQSRWLAGEAVQPFRCRDLGSLVSLGRYNAFGTLPQHGLFGGAFIRGRFAQLSHAMLYRVHQMELNGFLRGSLIWLADGLNYLVQPRNSFGLTLCAMSLEAEPHG